MPYLNSAERHAATALPPDAVHVESPDEVAAVLGAVRAAVVRMAGGAYVIAMIATSAVLVSAAPPTGSPVLPIIVIGTVITLLAVSLLDRILRHTDRLGVLSAELSDLYDRARLDSLRDPLTGLGNHRAFQEELDIAVESARRHQQSTALLLLDVDDLKRINDTEGHAAGDEVLQVVATLVVSNIRRFDRAFRIGGDEFAILSPQSTPEMALALGRRILAAALDDQRRPGEPAISFTVGISAVPEPSADRSLLYRHADAALYWGKRHGRTDVRVYDPRIQGIADDERPATELAAAVDRIVEERRLIPVYQPVFGLIDGSCRGFEGLVRPAEGSGFRHAGALFIAAEAVSRTVELDIASIRHIAAGAKDLAPDHYLAVNLSPRSLEAEAFNPHELLAILARAGIEPTRLVVELTEREAVEDVSRLNTNLDTLRRTGVRIAADDVGAGNAGLRLLSMVEFDVIKIDMSLVQGGTVLAPSRSVLHAIIEMAQQSGATTVAEGIETPAQLEVLRDLGIQVGQGYLLGMPRPRAQSDPVDIDGLLAPEPAHVAAASLAAV